MKIYTKKGDRGTTSLIGGTRLSKDHIRIEAYGTVDELNASIGLLRDQEMDDGMVNTLIEIQDRLFTIGSTLASDPEKYSTETGKSKMRLPELFESDVVFLEKEIDKMNESLPEMRSFVLPGGHTTVSFCHLARCICRRAERSVIRLSAESHVPEIIIKYLNRLSDYLFVLSRKLSQDLKAKEIPWRPRI